MIAPAVQATPGSSRIAAKPDYVIEGGKVVWKSQSLAATDIDIGERTLREWLADGCPRHPVGYCTADIVAWARLNKWRVETVDDDPDIAGPPSPALERLRDAKAKIAELDLKERQKQLVRVDEVVQPLMEAAAIVRAAGERIGREYGPEAQEVVNEAVAEFVASLGRVGGES